MQAIEERVADQSVLKLLRQILRAGVMQEGQVRREVTGAAQGGPVSPLLCNVYLHRLNREWDVRKHGVLARFADDLPVMCRTRQQAEAALARLRQVLAELGLVSAYELTCRRRYGQTCRGVERPDEHPAGHGQRARRAFTPATFKTEKRG